MGMPLRPLHLAVIDPAVRIPELDNFNRMVLISPELRLSYHLPALFGMSSLLKVPQKPDALVIFGSGASVYDTLPWQEALNQWIKDRLAEAMPTLGICYGHQLLAHLLGGRVAFAREDQEKYKGLRQFTFSERGFWGPAGTQAKMVVSHREIVVDLPSSLYAIGSSPLVAVEAFAHRNLPIWGIQAHPEAGPDFLESQSIDLSHEEKPFASGQEFLRGFAQHLRQRRIQ